MVIPHFPEIWKFRAAIARFQFLCFRGYYYFFRKSVSTAAFLTPPQTPPPPDFGRKIHSETEDPGRGKIRPSAPIFKFPSVGREGVPNLTRPPSRAKHCYASILGRNGDSDAIPSGRAMDVIRAGIIVFLVLLHMCVCNIYGLLAWAYYHILYGN